MRKFIFNRPATIVFTILSVCAILLIVVNACRKIDRRQDVYTSDTFMRERFFTVSGNIAPIVRNIIESIRRQDDQRGFVSKLVKNAGYALWDKTELITIKGQSHTTRLQNDMGLMAIIPFVQEGTNTTTAALAVKIASTDTTFDLIYPTQFRQYGFETNNGDSAWKARDIFHLFTRFDYDIFGHTAFKVKDKRLFQLPLGTDTSRNIIAKLRVSSTGGASRLVPVTECDVYDVCYAEDENVYATLCNSICTEECTFWIYWESFCTTTWVEDGNNGSGGGGEGGGGGGGGNWEEEECVDDFNTPENECAEGWTPDEDEFFTDYENQGFEHFIREEVSSEDEQIINFWKERNIDTIGLDPCLRTIIDRLIGSDNIIGKMLTKMERSNALPNNIEKFKITIKVDTLTGAVGKTLPGHYNTVTHVFTDTIVIKDSLMNFGTELSVAKTLIHELMHAYLRSMFHRFFYNSYTTSQIRTMHFDSLFNVYVDTLKARHTRLALNQWWVTNPEYDHNFMADRALERMVAALAHVDSNRNIDEYYWLLSWGGLWKTNTLRQYWPTAPSWPPGNPAPSNDSTRGLKYALTIARIDSLRRYVMREQHGSPLAKGRPRLSGGCY
jgi:hypothetical protein